MRAKGKARPAVAAAGRTAEMAAYGRAAIPDSHHTTAAAGRQIKIVDFLLHGAENGITLRHLEKMTGQDGRTVRRQIETERGAGALIVSDNRHGYFLTDDPAEAQRFARSMRRRACEITKTARAIEAAAGLD